MVHGNPTWSFYYRNVIKALSPNYRTVAPDHIGCGLSEKPDLEDYGFTLEERVKDLESFIKRLGLKDITLMVHDWGGMIGMTYAVRHPDNIKRLIVSNTAAFHLPQSKRFPIGLRFARDLSLGAFLVQRFGAFSKAANQVCTKRRPLSKEAKEAYLAPYDNSKHRLAVLRFVQDIPLKPKDPSYKIVEEVVSKLDLLRNKPMLLCWGAKDFVFDDHFLKEWQSIFPKAKVKRYADAGHYLLEDAGEEVISEIKVFLNETSQTKVLHS